MADEEASRAAYAAAVHRLIRLRVLGWTLIGAWQALSLLSEFVPIDIQSKSMRVLGKALGLVGLALIAYGFERLSEVTHRHIGLHE